MTAHPERGTERLPAWEEDTPPRRVRLAGVASLAAVPWIVVAVALLRPAPAPPALTTATGPDVARPATSARATDPPPFAGSDGAGDGTAVGRPGVLGTVLDGGAMTVPTVDEVGAVAVVVGRAFARGDGAPLDAGVAAAPGTGYVEHLVVEAVDAPSPDLVVVSLLAVVLHAEDGAYRRAELRRLAVPLAVSGDGVRPAATPWWLPAPALDPAPPTGLVAVDDPDLHLAVAEAVTAAGYRDVAVVSVSRTASWALVAEVEARAPGADAAAAHVLWLRQHLGGLLVAGTRPSAPVAPPPAGDEDAPPRTPSPSPGPEAVP